MARYVYLLNTYGEHGPERAVATLDRASLRSLLQAYGDYFNREYHNGGDIASELAKLDLLLAKPDEELAGHRKDEETAHNLSDGWGGIQLTVIPLDEPWG